MRYRDPKEGDVCLVVKPLYLGGSDPIDPRKCVGEKVIFDGPGDVGFFKILLSDGRKIQIPKNVAWRHLEVIS
jgi:hypothetical protein